MKIIPQKKQSSKTMKNPQNLSNKITTKLRKSKIFRNFTYSKNIDNIEVFKFLPPPAIKGAFNEGGGFEDEYLIVGFDTEFHFDENKKKDFLTYQFYIENFDTGYFFVCENGEELSFRDILLFFNKEFKYKKFIFIAHFGIVDYKKFKDYELILMNCKLNMKTIFGKFKLEVYDNNRNLKKFDIVIKDSMLLAGGGGLKGVGKVIGIEKIEIGDNIKRMKEFFKENFDKFVDYAMNDAVIAVKFFKYFTKTLVEVLKMDKNDILRVNTASSIGEVYFSKLLEQKGIDNKEFTGVSEIKNVYWNQKLGKLMKFVKVDFDEEMKIWEKGYYGGRNETFLFGVFNQAFYDYDIKNAYPLAMLSIQDVDWNNRIDITNEDVYKLKWNDLGFLYLKFEFNDDVKYPMFPIETDRGIVFVKKGTTIVTIPEFLTALNNGMLKSYYIKDGIKFKKKDSLTIPDFIKGVIEERSKYKKGTLENTIWKLIANSFYGKTAQGLTGKKTLDLRATIENKEKKYKKVGKSKITNHFIAGYITGVIRSLVSEYMHYFSKEGIKVVNVTTDGFMIDTKLSDDELKGIGFLTKKFSKVRKLNLGDDEILELKHWSDKKARNVVVKTRGYWLEPVKKDDVVLIARAGIQTKSVESQYDDDFEKRKAVYKFLTENFLKANYNVKYIQKNLYNIGDVLVGNVEDIFEFEREVSMNFDYDFKRKPSVYYDDEIVFERKSYVKLKIEDTKPWESVEEFKEVKNAYEKFIKHKTNVNKVQKSEELEKFFEYVKLQKYSDSQVHKMEQVILTKIIFVLLLKGFSNKEIAEILNIDVKKVEKRKYSKTFKKIQEKGIKKISQEEYDEVFKIWIDKNINDRNIKNLIKNELVLNENNDEEDYFEVVIKKSLNDF